MGHVIVAEVVFSLVVLAFQKVQRGWGWATLGLVCVVIAVLPALLAAARKEVDPPSRATGRLLVYGCLIFAAAQLVFALAMLVKPKVFDIGETTLAAALAVIHGSNPYAAQIDTAAGGIADDRFHGYKYLPVMIMVYAPLCLAFGMRGIIVTNILLQAMTAAVIRSIAAINGRRLAGLAAAMLYLSLPFVAHQIFTRGVTDLASVLPLLLALRYADERPTIAGVMVGLSIATKLVPGLVMLPCALPERGKRGRYLLGVMLGLLPILPFVATAPDAFFANVLLFNMVRPVDDTSWLFGLSTTVAATARIVAAGVLLAVTLRVWRRPPGLDERCGLAALATLAVFAVGPGMHHNYYLWFLPFLAILGGRAAIGAPVPADMVRSQPTWERKRRRAENVDQSDNSDRPHIETRR
jgi:Glycosyltransferase family 87